MFSSIRLVKFLLLYLNGLSYAARAVSLFPQAIKSLIIASKIMIKWFPNRFVSHGTFRIAHLRVEITKAGFNFPYFSTEGFILTLKLYLIYLNGIGKDVWQSLP